MYNLDNLKSLLLSLNIFNDNEYFAKYVKIIVDNLDTKWEKKLTQKHHIIPRCYFEHIGKEVDNSNNNIINLKYSDHILAHYFLCLSIDKEKEPILYKKLLCSFSYMAYGKHNYTGIDLENIEIIDNLKYKDILYSEYRDYLGELTSIRCKGSTLKDEVKLKLSIAHKNRVHIHKDNNDKLVKIEDLQDFLLNGWCLGRSLRVKNILKSSSIEAAVKGKKSTFKNKHHTDTAKKQIGVKNSGGKYIYKDGEIKHVKLDDLENYLDNGWTIGNPTKNKLVGRHWINNGETTKLVDADKIEQFIALGYKLGRK